MTTPKLTLLLLAALLFCSSLHAQIYVTNGSTGTITDYNLDGTPIGTGTLITGLDEPDAIAVSGSDIFITNDLAHEISEYTTSGSTVNANLVTGLSFANGIAVSGTDIFVVEDTQFGAGSIAEYNTAGTLLHASLVTGLNSPIPLAISGSDILVGNFGAGTINEYTTAGAPVGSGTLITGVDDPYAIAVSGSTIYVTTANSVTQYTTAGVPIGTGTLGNPFAAPNYGAAFGIGVSGTDVYVTNASANTIIEYSTAGTPVGSGTLDTGVINAQGMAVVTPVPEPSTWLLVACSGVVLIAFGLWRHANVKQTRAKAGE